MHNKIIISTSGNFNTTITAINIAHIRYIHNGGVVGSMRSTMESNFTQTGSFIRQFSIGDILEFEWMPSYSIDDSHININMVNLDTNVVTTYNICSPNRLREIREEKLIILLDA